jgi:hypothetical protein
MRALFLDFDGVVVTRHKDRVRLNGTGRWVRAATPENVKHLNSIIWQANPMVIVSSTWRKHHQLLHLVGTLRRAGYIGHVHGVTPNLLRDLGQPVERGYEIKAWLDSNPHVKRYVVLDDDADRGPIPEERWVRTDTFVGLTAHHAARAINVLLAEVGSPQDRARCFSFGTSYPGA